MASVFLCLKFTSLNKGKNWSVKSVVSLTQDFQLFLKNFNRGKMNSIYLFINISRTIMCSSKSCKIHLLMSFNLINRLYFCIISFQFFFFGGPRLKVCGILVPLGPWWQKCKALTSGQTGNSGP